MWEFTNCQRRDLEDGFMVCEDVQLRTGEICTAYFGPCGVYVISMGSEATASRLYSDLREILETVQVRLYIEDCGLYDPKTDSFGPVYDDETLTADVNEWIGERRVLYKPSVLNSMAERLEYEDARARGYKLGDDGQLYMYRNKQFKPVSEVSSDTNYFLNLFGGTLGLHRFALGKWFSGFIYLLTGGVFLVGWLSDLLFLFLGFQKDKKKRYLVPLSDIKKKLLLLPVGLIAGVVIFLFYLSVTNSFGNMLQSGVTQQAGSADPQNVQTFIDQISQFLASVGSDLSQ